MAEPRSLVPPMGPRIRALREAKGWSQLTLAGKVGCSDPTIARIEKGYTTNRSFIERISEVFDVDVFTLIRAEDNGEVTDGVREKFTEPRVMVQIAFRDEESWRAFKPKLKWLVPDHAVVSEWRGSFHVRVEMSPEDAHRLLAAIESGELSESGLESVILESPELSRRIRKLASESSDIRLAAAEALGHIGPEAVPALAGALRDENADVHWTAAAALGHIGPGAVPALLEALRSENADVRWAAAAALGRIGVGAAAAVPALLEALRDRDADVRWVAGKALVGIGPGAVPALLEALRSEKAGVRRAAVVVVGRIGPGAAEAIPALTALLEQNDKRFRNAVRTALVRMERCPHRRREDSTSGN